MQSSRSQSPVRSRSNSNSSSSSENGDQAGLATSSAAPAVDPTVSSASDAAAAPLLSDPSAAAAPAAPAVEPAAAAPAAPLSPAPTSSSSSSSPSSSDESSSHTSSAAPLVAAVASAEPAAAAPADKRGWFARSAAALRSWLNEKAEGFDVDIIQARAQFSAGERHEAFANIFTPSGYEPPYRKLNGEYVLTAAEQLVVEFAQGKKDYHCESKVVVVDPSTKAQEIWTEITFKIADKYEYRKSHVVQNDGMVTTSIHLTDLAELEASIKAGDPSRKLLSAWPFDLQRDIHRLTSEFILDEKTGKTDNTFNGKRIDELQGSLEHTKNALRYRDSFLTQFWNLLGVPTFQADLTKDQTGTNIFYQFIGYKEGRAWYKNAISILFTPLFNFIMAFPRMALNVARLVTEVLPLYAQAAFASVAAYAGYFLMRQAATLLDPVMNDGGRVFLGVVFALVITPITLGVLLVANVLSIAFSVIYYIGRSATSPLDSAKKDWVDFAYLGEDNPITYFFVRLLVVGFRISVTIAFYGVLLAFLAPLVASILAPYAVAIMPTWLASLFTAATPVIMLVVDVLATFVPAIATFSPLAVGAFALGAVASAVVVFFGLILKGPLERLVNRFRGNNKPADDEKPVMTDDNMKEHAHTATATPSDTLNPAGAAAVASAIPVDPLLAPESDHVDSEVPAALLDDSEIGDHLAPPLLLSAASASAAAPAFAAPLLASSVSPIGVSEFAAAAAPPPATTTVSASVISSAAQAAQAAQAAPAIPDVFGTSAAVAVAMSSTSAASASASAPALLSASAAPLLSSLPSSIDADISVSAAALTAATSSALHSSRSASPALAVASSSDTPAERPKL